LPNYDAGTASIKVKPSFKTFISEARAELRSMDLSVDARVGANTEAAKAEFAALRAEAGRDVAINVNADVTGAETAVESFRASQERRPVKIPVEADRAGMSVARSEFNKLASDLRQAGSLNLKVLGVVGAAGAIADLLAIADAAGQAAHAVALIPAIGFAGLAGVGSAVVGLKGIPDVFKEMGKASAGATDQAQKHTNALFDVSEAQYRLAQAQESSADRGRDYLRSQQDLNDAYRDGSRALRDMNDQLEDQKNATEDASIGVEEAAKRLREVQFDPTADSTTRRRALLNYNEAVQRLKEQQTKTQDLAQDTAEANAKGVEGSKQVVDAKDKVTSAAKAQAQAEHEIVTATEQLRRAQEQANESGGGGNNKLADAMAKLSPNARQLVDDIHSIGPAWTDARKAGQDALTAHLGPDIQHLADQQLPNLKNGIVGINTAFNTGIRGVLASLSSETNKADFKTSLDNTAAGFANAAAGAKPFTDGLTKLITVGTEFLPQMGISVDQMAIRFDNLIQRTAADGSLKKWIQDGLTSGRELLDIIEHLGSAVASVFRAAGNDGETLRNIDELTGHLAAFLKSTEGQQELSHFFGQAREEAAKLKPLLEALPGIIHGVTDGVRTWSEVTLPFLRAAADLLSAHPGLVQAAVVAYLGFKTVGPAIDGAKLAISALADKSGEAASDVKGVGKLKLAGAGLLNVLGNPWITGLALAGSAVIGFMSEADKASQSMQRYKDNTQAAIDADRNLQRALSSSHGALDSGVLDAETASVKQLRDSMAETAKDTPSFTDKFKLAPALYGSIFGVGQGVIDNEKYRISAANTSQGISDALSKLGLANDQLAQKITGNKPQFDSLLDQLSGMGQGGRDAAAHLQQLRDEWALDTAAVAPVTKAITDLSDKNKDAANSIDAATQALERQRQGGLTLEDAQLRVNQALTAFSSAADSASGAVVRADGSIDTTTSKGQALYQLLNSQLAPAWEQVTSAAYRDAIQHGQTADQAKAAAQQMSNDIRTSALSQIESMGFTQQQADTLLGHYVPLSKNFNATFTADTTQATNAVQAYQQLLDRVYKTEGSIPYFMQFQTPGLVGPEYRPGLSQGNTPNAATPPWYQYLPGRATGGKMPTTGPGTERRDGFLAVDGSGAPVARVDGGEWVIDRDNSKKYDRELTAIHAGVFPKLPGYDEGGVIGGQTIDKAAAARAVDQFAQSRSGQPYGGDEDCSGFISELANVAVGLPPKSGRMATSNEGPWLAAHGFQTGAGGYGAFRVGWVNDPSMAAGGHTAGTLPSGVNVESGGATGTVMYGGAAVGANHPMFTEHAYLQMTSAGPGTDAGPATSGVGGLAGASPQVNSQPVLYPQAPLPGRVSQQQLQKIQNQAAVDQANSERNRVYADPNSTAQDKQAADFKYLQAQNTLQQAGDTQDSDLLSLQGIFSRAGGILATGLLSSFGLENSILSSSNPYNKALNTAVNFYGGQNLLGAGGGYSYTPQNLPSIATTVTPQSTAPVTDPANQNAIPAAPNAAAPSAPTPGSNATSSSGGVVDTVRKQMSPYGWDTGAEWSALDQLVSHESSWNPTAQNLTSTAYGLFQFLDQTWATVGGSKTSDPGLQAVYGGRYIAQRYGTPSSAWAFWQAQNPHWYDQGGVADGVGFIAKNILRPERTLSPHQTETFDSALPLLESINASAWSSDRIQPSAFNPAPAAGAGRGGYTFAPTVQARVADVGDLVDRVAREGDKHAIGQMAALPV
jgi:hypothetical protein